MQDPVTRAGKAHRSPIPVIASSRRLVPLKRQSDVTQSGGQEWPQASARSTPSTGASTATCSRNGGDPASFTILLLASLLVISGAVPAASAQVESVQHQQASDRYAAHVAEAARRFGIPAAWIRAVMRIESGGDRRAVSPKGALGLMQLMPKTWADIRVRYGLGRDPFDPHDNILAGAGFLRELHDRYGSPGFSSPPTMQVPAATRIFAIDIVRCPRRPSPMSRPSSLLSMRRARQDLSSSRSLLVHPGRGRRCFSPALTDRHPPRQ
ncbi:hypothetical protein ACVWXM_003186 [Bradyrhizobium sp. GM7.3]